MYILKTLHIYADRHVNTHSSTYNQEYICMYTYTQHFIHPYAHICSYCVFIRVCRKVHRQTKILMECD